MSRFSLLVCLLLLAFPSIGFSQTSIGVVDVQSLLVESKAAKSIQQQIQSYRETFLKEISKREQSLYEKEKQLAEEGASLQQDEFAQKQKEFEQELLETRQLAQSKKTALEQASTMAQNSLREALYKVVGEIANERGHNLVISRQNVIVGSNSIDLTEEAMKRLNEKISEITLDIKYK